jgi:acyl carrier protein
MDTIEIGNRIKDIIANVSGLKRERIGDQDSLRDDLNLDSLSLLEIGVDVDYAFQLNLPDDNYKQVATLPQMVELVRARLEEMASVPATQ